MRPSLICLVTAHLFLSVLAFPVEGREPSSKPMVRVEHLPANPSGDFEPTTPLFTSAAFNTTVIYFEDFDGPGGCTPAGWTAVDRTAQTGTYFHVDDYAGLGGAFAPLAGTKSLWCGARPQSTGALCHYVDLPGYGNNWDQRFTTRSCIPVSGDGLLDVSFLMQIDSEPSYDALTLEYTTDCSGASGWTILDGGSGNWTGNSLIPVNTSYDVGGAQSVRVRLRFRSDRMYSDEDGLYPSNGGVHIDNLSVEDLGLEDFENDAVGATATGDWEAVAQPGYGNFAGLVNGSALVQEDPCIRNVSCMWAFFVGSAYDYGCGGWPQQLAVSYVNESGQYLTNEVWSPEIPLTGAGSVLLLEFSVYRDLRDLTGVFYVWHIRGSSDACPGPWKDRGFLYSGTKKDWYLHREDVSTLVDLATDTQVRIALGTLDACGSYCPFPLPGGCHSHAPLIDNVRLLRVDAVGPRWSIQDRYQFQDNFAGDGTLTGTVRADVAYDLNFVPLDAARVVVQDPDHGLGTDPGVGGDAVYIYAAVWPQGQAGKSGAALSGDPVRWPLVGTWTDMSGTSWTCLRMAPAAGYNEYDFDFDDNLFTPGDTVCFFYGARNGVGEETYAFRSNLADVTTDREQAASDAAEFTCLPAGGHNRGGDILYVDGMDGHGSQVFWDTAFAQMGLSALVDRYDVRGPEFGWSNRLAGRVTSVSQLQSAYRKILWDCGDLDRTLGDGTRVPGSLWTDDYGLVNQFLDGLTAPGGVYLCGNNIAEALNALTGPSAVTFRNTYLTHSLVSGDAGPAYGISPTGTPTPGSFFTDSFVMTSSCPQLNDFDVMEPTGNTIMQIAYGPYTGTNGAVLSQVTNHGVDASVVFSGFSFPYVVDDDVDGISDRVQHLHDIIQWLGNAVGAPAGADPPAKHTALHQNHPNPFNPQTTIAFSLRDRGSVRLVIYNVSGERVRVLASGELPAGTHVQVWDGRNDAGAPVSSGVYFYELVAGDFRQTRKMVLLK